MIYVSYRLISVMNAFKAVSAISLRSFSHVTNGGLENVAICTKKTHSAFISPNRKM